MTYPSLVLNRLRVMCQGESVYDQLFHEGVNIIRGENGSGKSTIADFIFFIFGGEFNVWKEAASRCDEVQAEISTPKGKLVLRREVTSSTQAPMWIFFGGFEEAQQHAIERWERFPIRRQERQESSSQVLFRSLTIPEAQSEGASNITVHQILRLLYSDQRTPATRIFRFDQWDRQDIREAVGNLICGVRGYEIYEVELKLRSLRRDLESTQKILSGLLEMFSHDESVTTPESIYSRIMDLRERKLSVLSQIKRVDEIIKESSTQEFLKERKKSNENLTQLRNEISNLESDSNAAKFEIDEIVQFLEYLNELLIKIAFAEATYAVVGAIDFTRCPACLSQLNSDVPAGICKVCGSEHDPDEYRSKYNQIRLDVEIQIRESNQLLDQKRVEVKNEQQELRRLRWKYGQLFSEFAVKFDLSSSPREGFLAQQNNEIGQIDREIQHLTQSFETVEEIQRLRLRKASLQAEIQSLEDNRDFLEQNVRDRCLTAMNEISKHTTQMLRSDIDRQEEFKDAHTVAVNFLTDTVSVDGQINFAESSNVFLKNSTILALFLAAGHDETFLHPRFLLIDNIEDKGMEPVRSHRFQERLVRYTNQVPTTHQVIYTTSMMNPELELDDYVIGPNYTHDHRTLDLEN